MSPRQSSPGFAGLGACLIALSGCSLDPYGKKTSHELSFVYRSLHPSALRGPMSSLAALSNDDLVRALGYDPPPLLSSGYDCLAVNVVGPGIANSDAPKQDGSDEDPATLLARMYAGSSCAYAGILSPPLPLANGSSTTLMVPAGPGRIIQVLGIDDADARYCGASVPINQVFPAHDTSADNAKFVEMGRAIVDVFSNTTINVSNTFDALAVTQKRNRVVNCGEGNRPIQFNGLSMWYEAGYFLGRVTTPVVGTPTAVSGPASWEDSRGSSGYGPTLSITNSFNFEANTAAALNTQYSLDLATGGASNASSGLSSSSTGLTFFVVLKGGVTGATIKFAKGTTATCAAAGDQYLKLAESSGNWHAKVCDFGSGIVDNATSPAVTTELSDFKLLTVAWRSYGTGSTLKLWKGASGNTSAPDSSVTTGALSTLDLSGQVLIDLASSASVAELIVYNRELDGGALQSIWSYAKFKYGNGI